MKIESIIISQKKKALRIKDESWWVFTTCQTLLSYAGVFYRQLYAMQKYIFIISNRETLHVKRSTWPMHETLTSTGARQYFSDTLKKVLQGGH